MLSSSSFSGLPGAMSGSGLGAHASNLGPLAGPSMAGGGAFSAAVGTGGGFGVSLADDFLSVGAGSSSRTRLLELNVEYRDRMIHLKVGWPWLYIPNYYIYRVFKNTLGKPNLGNFVFRN